MPANLLFQTLETTDEGLARDVTEIHFGAVVEPDLTRSVLALIAPAILLLPMSIALTASPGLPLRKIVGLSLLGKCVSCNALCSFFSSVE